MIYIQINAKLAYIATWPGSFWNGQTT